MSEYEGCFLFYVFEHFKMLLGIFRDTFILGDKKKRLFSRKTKMEKQGPYIVPEIASPPPLPPKEGRFKRLVDNLMKTISPMAPV